MYLCPKEIFKIKIVDIYIQTVGNKAVGEQKFTLFEDLCHNAGPHR